MGDIRCDYEPRALDVKQDDGNWAEANDSGDEIGVRRYFQAKRVGRFFFPNMTTVM
jgi:hypothetical protein